MNANEMIFYSPNNAAYPWIENATCDTRHIILAAVTGLLIEMDKAGTLKPQNLESFHWDSKNNYTILRLKPDLYFTNGRKVTIEDLEFSILRYFFAAKPNEGSMQLVSIKGSEKINHGDPYFSGLVEGVKILDCYSIAVTTSAPYPNLMYLLARWITSLVPREELQADLLNWKKWPIGVGPYKVTKENKLSRSYVLELVNVTQYPNAPQKIIFTQDRKIEPDLSLRDAISYQDDFFQKTELDLLRAVRLMSFNFSSKFGSDPDFRNAVNLALQRKKIAPCTLSPTKPLNELVPKEAVGWLGVEENYNVDLARQLFKKSLGIKIYDVFKIPYSPDLDYLGKAYREEIQRQLKAAGLNVEFVISTNLWNPFIGEFENSPFWLYSKGADFYDPLTIFTMFKKGSPAINSYPNDDKLEQLIEEAKESSGTDVFKKSIENLSKYFLDNNVVVVLLEISAVAHYNPLKIKSIGKQLGGHLFLLQNVRMNDEQPLLDKK